MMNPDYEVKGGKLFVNSEAVPLRKGLIHATLARAGWSGYEGPVSRAFFETVLSADRRISIVALTRELQSSVN